MILCEWFAERREIELEMLNHRLGLQERRRREKHHLQRSEKLWHIKKKDISDKYGFSRTSH